MQNVMGALLEIEKTAQEAFVADAHDDVDEIIQAEIARGVAALERDADGRIAVMERESQVATAVQIEQIKAEYGQKTQLLEQSFAEHREAWLAQILKDVLHT